MVVHTRDAVRIQAIVGNMRITTTGEALDEGRVGQTIHVRNTDSQKVILGRVVEHALVNVEY